MPSTTSSRSSTTRQRKPAKKNKNKGNKKQCSRGVNCPFKHEYQHQLEFYHDDDETEQSAEATQQTIVEAFSGQGRSMGSSSVRNRSDDNIRSAAAAAAMSRFQSNCSVVTSNDNNTNYTVSTSSASSKRDVKRHISKSKVNNDVIDLSSPPQQKKLKTSKSSTLAKSHKPSKTSKETVIDLLNDSDTDEDGSGLLNHRPPVRKEKGLSMSSNNLTDDEIEIVEVSNNKSRSQSTIQQWQDQADNNLMNDAVALGLTREEFEQQKLISQTIAANHYHRQGTTQSDHGGDPVSTIGPTLFPHNFSSLNHHEEEQRQMGRALAESNRAVVQEQDAEYYESLRQDQEKERLKREQEKAEIEKITMEKNKIYNAKQNLEPEPPENDPDAAIIAFKLPSSCKVPRLVRRFKSGSKADQMIYFLEARPELQSLGGRWSLREVYGTREITFQTKETIASLNLSPRGILIVRPVD